VLGNAVGHGVSTPGCSFVVCPGGDAPLYLPLWNGS
jgi:hypothetical protein